jgi:hypothetical protein
VELDEADWTRLERLRGTYLSGRGRSPWRDARDLELYDATFGRRIAWKWRAVLDELAARKAELPRGRVLDWGCGSGVAAEAWIAAAGAEELALHDAAPLAQRFAAEKLRRLHPELPIAEGVGAGRPDVLLVSHVLGELPQGARDELVALARTARWSAWVEPGSSDVSRALGAVRDALLDAFDVVAPCTHALACPMLARERDWCHFFARPAPEAFTAGHWARFGKRLGIDLRSLPYAFVVLRRREAGDAPPTPPGLDRIVGRPRIEKGRALLDACGAPGLRALRLLERDDRAFFGRCEDAAGECLLYRLVVEEGRVRSAERAT